MDEVNLPRSSMIWAGDIYHDVGVQTVLDANQIIAEKIKDKPLQKCENRDVKNDGTRVAQLAARDRASASFIGEMAQD